MDRVVYFDLVGGASGDMLLAALVDAGAPLEAVRSAIAAVGLRGVTLESQEVSSAGLRALRVRVRTPGGIEGPARLVPVEASGGLGAESHVPGATHAEQHLEPMRGHAHVEPGPRPRTLHEHEHGGARFHRHVRDVHAHPGPSLHLAVDPEEEAGDEGGDEQGQGLGPGRARGHSDHVHEHVHDHVHGQGDGDSRGREGPDLSGHLHRPYRVVRALIEGATGLSEGVRALALDAFHRLGAAEAHAHGVPLEAVTFHEVGSDDAIADVVGVAAALEALGVSEVRVSPVPMGRGLTRGAHGPIPLPGPATLSILEGVPIEGVPLAGETVTPTGAAILRAAARDFGAMPPMILERTGVGAGARAWPDRPNVVRALVGRPIAAALERSDEDAIVETNLDDMSPEHVAALSKALFAAGAIDVWSCPIAMKKGRTGVLVSALVRRTLVEAVAGAMLLHSTTLGVRVRPVERLRGSRRIVEVETPFGRVRVKVSDRPSGPALVSPEFDDCERLAERAGVSVRAVSEAALYAAWSMPKPAD